MKRRNMNESNEKIDSKAIVQNLKSRFLIPEEELGDDPVLWRQNDTVNRIAKYLEKVLP